MRHRKKPVAKVAVPRTRTATAGRGSNPAWKVAEREVCRYFGTERAPVGQKGHDSREVPVVENWLRDKAPELLTERFGEAIGVDHFTHVFVESKCHAKMVNTLERWHTVVQSNPDKKVLLPLMFMGDIGDAAPPSRLIGFCRLDDFPRVYRGFLAPPMRHPALWIANLFNRFWSVRYTIEPPQFVYDALKQSEADAAEWKSRQTVANTESIRPLSVVYLKYPKRMTPALVFRVPSFGA